MWQCLQLFLLLVGGAPSRKYEPLNAGIEPGDAEVVDTICTLNSDDIVIFFHDQRGAIQGWFDISDG